MNKYLKGCLIIMVIIVLTISIIAGWIWWSLETNQKRADEDNIKFSKECDTIAFITERPSISLGKFHKTEIDQLRYYIIRNNKIIKDTLVNYKITSVDHYLNTNIPFDNFKKSDTIIVVTKNKKYYSISGFQHYAYLHYGMFGYVGSHDCRFDHGNYIVNGKSSNGTLLKKDGINDNILPK